MTRWHAHLRAVKRGEDSRFYRSIRKYGIAAFDICMLDETDSDFEAYALENEWIVLLKRAGFDLYNLNDGGIGGKNPSKETLEKMSQIKRGKVFSEEHRSNIRKAAQNRPPVSEETKAKLRLARARRSPPSDETRKKTSSSMKGKRLPTETKEKIRQAAIRQWQRRPASTHQGYAP